MYVQRRKAHLKKCIQDCRWMTCPWRWNEKLKLEPSENLKLEQTGLKRTERPSERSPNVKDGIEAYFYNESNRQERVYE